MSVEERYKYLLETSEFQRMWAEGYSINETYDLFKSDFIVAGEYELQLQDVVSAYEYLDTKMKKQFLAVYNLEN